MLLKVYGEGVISAPRELFVFKSEQPGCMLFTVRSKIRVAPELVTEDSNVKALFSALSLKVETNAPIEKNL